MSFFVGLLLETAIILCEFIWPCRIISMVFSTFSRSITIRNDKLAEMFIAEKMRGEYQPTSEKEIKCRYGECSDICCFSP